MEKIRKGEMALVDNGQTVHPQISANRTVWDNFYFNKKRYANPYYVLKNVNLIHINWTNPPNVSTNQNFFSWPMGFTL